MSFDFDFLSCACMNLPTWCSGEIILFHKVSRKSPDRFFTSALACAARHARRQHRLEAERVLHEGLALRQTAAQRTAHSIHVCRPGVTAMFIASSLASTVIIHT